jgi:mannan endo-1,4-beta-mannosidase
MAWQLANEPRPGRNNTWLNQYYIWIESAAQYIHSIDQKHLVSTGNEGLAGSLQDSVIYLTAHRSKNIDYLTFHLWPKNWSWFDAKNIAKTYQTTENNAVAYINQHIAFAADLNKPIVMEEFGLPRDSEFCKTTSPTTARDRYYKKVLTLIYDSSAAGAAIAGTNVWAWGGEGRGKHPDDQWIPGDPFVGDPPQEPQGFNSIFDSDSTTIAILKDHAEKMESLNRKR